MGFISLLHFLQTNVPVEEARKNIWLVDSKVCDGRFIVVLFFYFILIEGASLAGINCQFP